MKTAIYIQDGDVQLVLTPENEWEKNAMNSFGDQMEVSVMRGQFYECKGGWNRFGDYQLQSDADRSLILRIREEGEGES